MTKKDLDKVKFCVRFLIENGIDADEFARLSDTLSSQDIHYELIEVKVVSRSRTSIIRWCNSRRGGLV